MGSLPYFEQSLVIRDNFRARQGFRARKAFESEHFTTAALLLDYASATERAGRKPLSRKLRKRAEDLLGRINHQSPSQMTVSLSDLRAAK